MTILSHHIRKLFVALSVVILVSLPGAMIALYSLSH
jgi:hypothetical protein